MQHIFIVNPKSGSFQKNYKKIQEITDICRKYQQTFEFVYTKAPKDAWKIAEIKSKEWQERATIYSLGGDGTMNEILNGIQFQTKMCIISMGTGNDANRTFKSESSLEELIMSPDQILVDVGYVNQRRFLNVASIGIDADINEWVNQTKNMPIPNSLRYYFSALKQIIYYEQKKVIMSNASVYKEFDLTMLAICNGKYYGHGFMINPFAIVDDGKLEIVYTSLFQKLQMISLFLKAKNGNHLNNPNMSYFQSDELFVETETPVICNIDGESKLGTNFQFSVKPKALKLIR